MKYSIILKQMQMAYMGVTMRNNNIGEQCIYCWKSTCSCGGNTVKNDPFINLNEEDVVIDELLYV